MATILEFRGFAGRTSAPGGARRGLAASPAEIVFFPGVRYERHIDDGVAKSARGNSRRKRDQLEIDE